MSTSTSVERKVVVTGILCALLFGYLAWSFGLLSESLLVEFKGETYSISFLYPIALIALVFGIKYGGLIFDIVTYVVLSFVLLVMNTVNSFLFPPDAQNKTQQDPSPQGKTSSRTLSAVQIPQATDIITSRRARRTADISDQLPTILKQEHVN